MTAPNDTLAALATSRFGLGARPGELAAAGGDPRGWLLAQLGRRVAAPAELDGLAPGAEVLGRFLAAREERREERRAAARGDADPVKQLATSVREVLLPHYLAQAAARTRIALATGAPFRERLVQFWTNHFAVSVDKPICLGTAGALENEAIRPHVCGRFAELLLAVEMHPAMVTYLDNQQSVGPDSALGERANRRRGGDPPKGRTGLNENLAREILELHTMGVGSGYAQADVTQLAFILTGWTIVGRDGKLGEPGGFAFNPNAHEPLAATVRGRLYVEDGVAQGEAALADLAREPATARHIATKFARHFVADAPDPGLVARLAKTFRDSDGDLGALARALVADDAAWRPPATKVRNPWELTVAAYRAFGRSPSDAGPALGALDLLGMPLWRPGGPNGFSDDSVAAWASPEGMKTRVALAQRFASQIKDAPSPTALLEDVIGPTASEPTRQAVARAESRQQAYALLILSPEFQRR
ncbi:MAG TPA: DUF1800 family protein [Steroidobacteraceae bacterium]|nr:DUF1800 family protein [Steroidobacteraceae bacterium]